MKVSRERKEENKQALIDAFVTQVRARGYDGVSLRDVARAAGLSDGAVYKHFPSKEKILLAYYAAGMERVRAEAARLAARPGYGLVDRMQALLESHIARYEGDKDFLRRTFRPTFVAASLMWSEVAALRKAYVGSARAFLEAAEAAGEARAGAWPGVVDEMLWCHYVAVMLYWLQDGSEAHEDTSQFIDRTLQVLIAVVGGPLLPMAQDLIGFLVNRHLMPLLLDLGGLKRGAPWTASPPAEGREPGTGGGRRERRGPAAASAPRPGRKRGSPAGKGRPGAGRRGAA